MQRIVILTVFATLCLPAAPLTARQWTDNTGAFTVEAELVEVSGNIMRLRKPDGQIVTVPLDRLSAADREYVRSAGARGQAAAKPALATREDAIRQKLQQPTKFGFIGTPLYQVLEWFSDQHDLSIQIDRRALLDVRQTFRVHRPVAQLLADLREAKQKKRCVEGTEREDS